MIDTIRLRIRIPDGATELVAEKLLTYSTTENESGEVLRSLVRGQLTGSFDYRVGLQIRDTEWKSLSSILDNNFVSKFVRSDNRVVEVKCDPYLIVEFSLEKWAYCLNFINCSLQDAFEKMHLFRLWLNEKMMVELPELHEWLVERVDLGKTYNMGVHTVVIDYIRCMSLAHYPRRKRPQIYDSSFHQVGTTTTIKMYCKYTEFKAHDYKRMRRINKNLGVVLSNYADGIIRVEVGFRKRKLVDLGVRSVIDLFGLSGWEGLFMGEIVKMSGERGKVYTHDEVANLLMVYKENGEVKGVTVEACIAIWSTIVLHGRKRSVELYGLDKVKRAVRVFKKLGIGFVSNLMEGPGAGLELFRFPEVGGEKEDEYFDIFKRYNVPIMQKVVIG